MLTNTKTVNNKKKPSIALKYVLSLVNMGVSTLGTYAEHKFSG